MKQKIKIYNLFSLIILENQGACIIWFQKKFVEWIIHEIISEWLKNDSSNM